MKGWYLFNIQPACGALSDNYFCTETHIFVYMNQFIYFHCFSVTEGVVGGSGANPSCHQVASLTQGHIDKQPFTLAITPTVQGNIY